MIGRGARRQLEYGLAQCLLALCPVELGGVRLEAAVAAKPEQNGVDSRAGVVGNFDFAGYGFWTKKEGKTGSSRSVVYTNDRLPGR